MMAGEVQEAERLVRIRAVLFCMMAATATASVLIGLKGNPSPARLGLWLVMIVLMAANLTGSGGWLKPVAVRRLMNDETTREHRRTSTTIGFWTMIGGSLLIAVLADRLALVPGAAAELIVTAGLSAAFVAFAVLELRASSD
jgi:uncharacterized protein (DUF58 family)